MLRNSSIRAIVFIWIAWVVIVLGYQAIVPARYTISKPDNVLSWTPRETRPTSQDDQPYLLDPFLNAQVSWDSEFYLSIATLGYDDPQVRSISVLGTTLSLNYAFFPMYSYTVRLVALPLSILGLSPIATSTLAAVIVSALGALAAMLALYDMTRDELSDAGGIRAAFYLIIFPTGFFLVQVYTEGLFVGLAFTSLALMRRNHRGWAALLAVFATWTRAVGVALVIPLAITWLRTGEWTDLDMEWKQIITQRFPWRTLRNGLIGFAPLIAFIVWKLSWWGAAFSLIEDNFFGRGLFAFNVSFNNWAAGLRSLSGANSQTAVYYAIEFGAIVLGFVACLSLRRRYPELAWFGLAVIILSMTSGPAQGMHRYLLAVPPVFVYLSHLGRHPAFDRAWTTASVLLMGMLAALFAFDMWVG